MRILTLFPNMKDARVKFGCRLAGDNGNLGPLDSLLPPLPHFKPSLQILFHSCLTPGLSQAQYKNTFFFSFYPLPIPCSLNTPHASACHTPYICYAGSIMQQGPTEPSCEEAYHAPRSRDALQVLFKEAQHSILGEANPCYQPHKFLKRWPVAWNFLTTTETFQSRQGKVVTVIFMALSTAVLVTNCRWALFSQRAQMFVFVIHIIKNEGDALLSLYSPVLFL